METKEEKTLRHYRRTPYKNIMYLKLFAIDDAVDDRLLEVRLKEQHWTVEEFIAAMKEEKRYGKTNTYIYQQ